MSTIINFNASSPIGEEAAKKINAEMQKNANDAYIEIIGTYVIDRFSASSPGGGRNDAVADKVSTSSPEGGRSDIETAAEAAAAGKKTLQGALGAVKAAARKVAKGNCAVMLPKDVFGEVDKYFGFSTDTEAQQKALFASSPYGGGSSQDAAAARQKALYSFSPTGGEGNKVSPPPAGGLSMSLADFL